MLRRAGQIRCLQEVNTFLLDCFPHLIQVMLTSHIALREKTRTVGGRPVALIRKLDRSPAVELGEGLLMELSPDGNWVATLEPMNLQTLSCCPPA